MDYIGAQFDQRIWESDVFHFGNYVSRSPRPDIDGKRAAIFVHNIRDEAYWSSYRFYIAGYFSSGLNDDLQLNAIFVDSYNWQDRLGVNTTRPSLSYLYEGTVAHEFQHLIHHDVDRQRGRLHQRGHGRARDAVPLRHQRHGLRDR